MTMVGQSTPLVPTRATKSLAGVWTWGVELRLWVASCVTGLSLFSLRSLGFSTGGPAGGPERLALLVVFFSTLALYNLDGTLDAPDSAADTRRRRTHLILTSVSAGVVLILLAQLSMASVLLVGGGGLLCASYAVPFQRAGVSHRIKALPHLKGPFVGTAVATAVVWVPLWSAHRAFSFAEALLLTLILALYCTANALLFDIPDILEDQQARVPTIAARAGLAQTRRVSVTLCCLGLGLSLATHQRLPLLALGLVLLIATFRITENTSKKTVAWWVDGALLLPFLLS